MKLSDEERLKLFDYARQCASSFIEYEYGAEVKIKTPIVDVKRIDCSELVEWLFSLINIAIVDGACNQYTKSIEISETFGETGDLVFKRSKITNLISHVGMYLGNGWIIEAEGWVGSVILRPLSKFKAETTNNIYAGMRRLIGDK